VMHRMGVRQTFIQGPLPRQERAKVVGPVVTLQFMPRREDVVWNLASGAAEEHVEKHSALWAVFETVQPGDILAVQANGDMHTGCMGEMLITYFKGRGGAGIVVDGCIRDWPAVQKLDVPLWTRGFTPKQARQLELRRLVLTEARLGMLENGLRDPHDVLAAPVNLRLHLRFEFIYGWHGNSCCCKLVRLLARL